MADVPEHELDVEALQEQLNSFSIEQFLVSTASTLASLAYAKLERKELAEARRAIDALAALVPQLQGELANDLALALTQLQVAYSSAATA
jgi:hypothetical protein